MTFGFSNMEVTGDLGACGFLSWWQQNSDWRGCSIQWLVVHAVRRENSSRDSEHACPTCLQQSFSCFQRNPVINKIWETEKRKIIP